jgi:putative ABC transport system permease protein
MYDMFRRPGWLALLVGVVALATASVAFTSAASRALEGALRVGIARAGADIAVVPAGQGEDFRRVLVTGEPKIMSFPDPTSGIRTTRGVSACSSQLFVASAQADCCSAGDVLIVAVDPDTDFVVRPWVRRGALPTDGSSVLTGVNLRRGMGLPITFYGTRLTVVGGLEPTGWGFFDNAAFVTRAAVEKMVEASRTQTNVARLNVKRGETSVVWVRTSGDSEVVARRLRAEVPGADVLEMAAFLPSVRESSRVLGRGMGIVSATLVGAALLTVAATFSLALSRRSRDLAVIRAAGVSRRGLTIAILVQAGLIGMTGGLIGGAVGGLAAHVFAQWMSLSSHLPVLAPSWQDAAVLALAAAALASIGAALTAAGPALAYVMRGVSDAQR